MFLRFILSIFIILLGFKSKQIRFAIVDLPAPDVPTKAIDFFAGIIATFFNEYESLFVYLKKIFEN